MVEITEPIQFLKDKYRLLPEQVAAILKETCGGPVSSKNILSDDSYSDNSFRDHGHNEYSSGVN